MGALIHDRRWRVTFLFGVAQLRVGALSLVALRFVRVKMLPFDNKSERNKHERPETDLPISTPELPEGTDVPSVGALAPPAESVLAVEATSDSEPVTEKRTEGEYDPKAETSDAAGRTDDDGSADSPGSA